MHDLTTPLPPWTALWRALGVLLAASSLHLAPSAASAGAQNEAQVSARLSVGVLRMGDTGYVNLTVENARDARLVELPRVDGLKFADPGSPSRNDFRSMINGRVYVERSLTWSIPFRGEAEGDFEIPPLAVEVDGKRLATRSLHVTVRRDITGADYGYMEVHPSGTTVVEGQPFTVELTFGWDESRTGQVTFAELNLPWWDSLPGAIELEGEPIPQNSRVMIPVNGGLKVAAEQLENRDRGGRSFITLRITKSFLPTRSGTLEFPTSFFEFGRLRQAGFFDTRRESHFVQADPFTIEVIALPSEGQPMDFSGAVGALSARASADVRDVRVGDSIKLTAEWSGDGNLQYFRIPDPGALDSFRGFRVYGTTEEKSPTRRKVVYDLAPLSTEVQAIPPIPLSVFDPAKGAYETITTAPIPIRVRPLEKGRTLSDDERRFEQDISDIDTRAPGLGAEVGGVEDRFLLGALAAVPLLGLWGRSRARRRMGDPGAPLERRRRRARRELTRRLRGSPDASSRQAAMHEFLAARTRESASAWNGRDFAGWAEERVPELPQAVRQAAATELARLDAAVWGGAPAPDSGRLLELARELQEAGL